MNYVNRAIKRYEEDGLAAMVARYDSVASFECDWYLFATDANDTYIVHPFRPALKGTDIKDLDKDFTDLNGESSRHGTGKRQVKDKASGLSICGRTPVNRQGCHKGRLRRS